MLVKRAALRQSPGFSGKGADLLRSLDPTNTKKLRAAAPWGTADHQTKWQYPWRWSAIRTPVRKAYLKLDGSPRLKAAAWIHYSVAKRLARASGLDLTRTHERRAITRLQAGPIVGNCGRHIVSKIRPFESNNVLAMLPGSDGRLKENAVMYTAHYDHLGIVRTMPATTFITSRRQRDRLPAFCSNWLALQPMRTL